MNASFRLMAQTAGTLALVYLAFVTTRAMAQTPPAQPKPKRPVSGAGVPGAPGASRDADMVERLLASRKEYQIALESLRTHYVNLGDLERARFAEEELIQYHRIVKNPFLLELDVPPPNLQGTTNIPEANELYRRAMTFKDKGWGNDYTDNQRRSEILLQQLLSNPSTSNKISDTAYQLGDLYEGKAYKQYQRAALYYERAHQWNPLTSTDARLRAARIYDRLGIDRNRAIELYKEIVQQETDTQRIQEAQRRLADLGGR